MRIVKSRNQLQFLSWKMTFGSKIDADLFGGEHTNEVKVSHERQQ